MRNAIGPAMAATLLAAAAPTHALEKTSVRVIDRDAWGTSTTYTVRYYNNCTGWVWVWSGWNPGETVGVTFDATGAGCWNYLNTSWALTFSGVPSGYGFTGTIAVTDGGCGAVIATQPYLAPFASGWGATRWGGVRVESGFSINITWGAPEGLTNSSGLASDHPLAGPTGPMACGTCYPSTRMSNSRYYGVGGAYCPSGTTLSDGLCDIELMIEATIQCVFSVEDGSWGKIKSLYR